MATRGLARQPLFENLYMEIQVSNPKNPKKPRNSQRGTQSGRQKNAFVLKANSTMTISAGIKTKSVTNAVRRVTKQANIAVSVKRVFEMAVNLETHITWRQQTMRERKNAKNTPRFT